MSASSGILRKKWTHLYCEATTKFICSIGRSRTMIYEDGPDVSLPLLFIRWKPDRATQFYVATTGGVKWCI